MKAFIQAKLRAGIEYVAGTIIAPVILHDLEAALAIVRDQYQKKAADADAARIAAEMRIDLLEREKREMADQLREAVVERDRALIRNHGNERKLADLEARYDKLEKRIVESEATAKTLGAAIDAIEIAVDPEPTIEFEPPVGLDAPG